MFSFISLIIWGSILDMWIKSFIISILDLGETFVEVKFLSANVGKLPILFYGEDYFPFGLFVVRQ